MNDRRGSLSFAVVLFVLFFIGSISPAWSELQGDDQAVALANEMVEALGGHQIWAAANWMHIKEQSFSLNHKTALQFEAWRGLKHARSRYQVKTDGFEYKQAWTKALGWRVRNGEFVEFDDERLALEVEFWPKEIYTMYHRLAAGDSDLRLIAQGARGFRIEHSETSAPLGSFTVSPEGGPLVWSSGDTEDDVTYVYGPLKSFGKIRLPAWGAQTNGSYRFNYTDASLHTEPEAKGLFELPAEHTH